MGKLKRGFNDFAKAIRRIVDAKLTDKDLKSVLEDREGKRKAGFIEQFPELIDKEGHPQIFELVDLQESFFQRFEKAIEEYDVYGLIALLSKFEYGLGECYKRKEHFEEDVEIYEALNSNLSETQIAIVPKVSCGWEHRQIRQGINNILQSFYYIDYKNFDSDYKITHYNIIKRGFLKNERVLKIAVSPVTKNETVKFSEPYSTVNEHTGEQQLVFRVDTVLNGQELTYQIINKIFKAGKEGADILVFPEMLGTEKMLETVLEAIRGEANAVPALIMFPSIWRKTENDENNENFCPVIFRGREVLFTQKKYGDFHYEKNGFQVYEDINRKDGSEKEFHLIHIDGIGRICIVICYDFLAEDIRKAIMENLKPTLICTPSFSTGSFNFEILAQAGFEASCNWAWCNTCSAMHQTEKRENFQTVGMITTLSKKCDLKDVQTRCKGAADCIQDSCEECLYFAEIPLKI